MSRANPTLVGSFVVGGLALGIAAAIALGAQGASKHVKPFVVQLTGTVNGLRPGAPVKFKGVQVGEVDRIKIRILERPTDVRVPDKASDLPIAVFCSIDEKQLEGSTVGDTPRLTTIPELVAAGLRARMATESMVTGILYISLTFTPEEQGARYGDLDGFPEVPALQSSSERMESGLERVLDKFAGLDLAGLIDQVKAAVKSIDELAGSKELRASLSDMELSLAKLREVAEALDRDVAPLLARLGKTAEKTDTLAADLGSGVADAREVLASAKKLIDHVDRALDPFSTSLSAAAGDVGGAARKFTGTLDGFDATAHPDAPLVVDLQAALAELAGAARAARSLLEQLDRDPSQLLRGRAVESH